MSTSVDAVRTLSDLYYAALRGRRGARVEPGRAAAGFFFGRTPLIKLSPKKTWEGFFGGLVLTMLCSWLLADLMSRGSWMICPRTARPLAGASSGLITTGRSAPPGRLLGTACDFSAPEHRSGAGPFIATACVQQAALHTGAACVSSPTCVPGAGPVARQAAVRAGRDLRADALCRARPDGPAASVAGGPGALPVGVHPITFPCHAHSTQDGVLACSEV